MSKSDKPLVVFLGPAYPYRGGIASFTNRLAKEFNKENWQSLIYTFSLQYPGFLFPGKTQFSKEFAPKDLVIKQAVNSINPINWVKVGNELNRLAPDLIVVRYWLPFMAPAFGTILRLAKRNGKTKVICIADNIIPHEKRLGDTILTSYFKGAVDAFVAMSEQVMQDLAILQITKPNALLPHPLFDHFGEKVDQHFARTKLHISHTGGLLLFFGFIRHYKGLDLLIQAMSDERVKQMNLKLVVAGEFYEDEEKYKTLVAKLGLNDEILFFNEFIPDEQVPLFMSAVDVLVQPYRHATQSGVTPLAMHFDLPMVVTDAGGLKEIVVDKESGLVVEKTPEAIADGIVAYFGRNKADFVKAVQEQKIKYSWNSMFKGIVEMMEQLRKAK
jgi:glycosyltransferase involved in cell wall biosynthesis